MEVEEWAAPNGSYSLGATGETRQAARLAKGADAVTASGDDLVRIGLMAHVPDQPVVGGVEHGMDGDRQLHHAQRGPEMSACRGDRLDRFRPQLVRDLFQLVNRQVPQVNRVRNTIQQRKAPTCGDVLAVT